MKLLASVLIAVVLAGCNLVGNPDSTTDDIVFRTDQSSYALNSTVIATLENRSDQSIEYNLCFSHLEKKQNTEWSRIGLNMACQAIALKLQPGEQAYRRIALDDSLNLSEGQYRVTTEIGSQDEKKKLTTQIFDVSPTVQQK